MAMFAPARSQVKATLERLLPPARIQQALEASGSVYRRRRLPPATSVYLLLLQLLANVSLAGLRHVAQIQATASAICQARSKLPLKLFYLLIGQTAAAGRAKPQSLFCGRLQVLLADAASLQCQETPELTSRYGQPKNQHKADRGYPALKLLCLMDHATGLIWQIIDLPWRCSEHKVLRRLLSHLSPRRVLLGDRGFASFGFLACLMARGAHACLRVPARQQAGKSSRRKCVKRLSSGEEIRDTLVVWEKPASRAKSFSKRAWGLLPKTLVLRELCYRVSQAGFRTRQVTVITTLLDALAYPAREIAGLYAKRWQIEVYFRDLKRSQKLLRLRAKSASGARKELLGHVLLYNLVRQVMIQAACRQNTTPDRISFQDALVALRYAPVALEALNLAVNPRRQRLAEPRRVKYLQRRYPDLRKPRAQYQRELNGLT